MPGCSLDLDRLRDSRDGQVLDAADDLDARDLDASGVDAPDLDALSTDAPSIDARVEATCTPACESGFRCVDVALDATGDVSLSVTPSVGDGTFEGALSVRVGRANRMAFFPASAGSGPAIVATGPSDLYFVEAGSPLVAHPLPLVSSDLLDVVIADLDDVPPAEVVVADAIGGRIRAFRVTADSLTEVQSIVVGTFGPTADLAAVDIDDDGSSELVLITGGALSIVGVLAPTCP